MARTVAIQQPTYLPWMGYMEQMANVDVFVLLDTVQFEPRSWQQRNRVKAASGEVMLTVPCRTAGRRFQLLKDVEIDNTRSWWDKHWRTVSTAYARSPYNAFLTVFHQRWLKPWDRLVDLNIAFLSLFRDFLDIDTPMVRASELGPLPSGKEAHIVGIMKAVGGDVLYDAAGAEFILDPKPFDDAGIELVWQKYRHPCYRQLHGDFLPYMSAMDVILNEGEKARQIILSGSSWQR